MAKKPDRPSLEDMTQENFLLQLALTDPNIATARAHPTLESALLDDVRTTVRQGLSGPLQKNFDQLLERKDTSERRTVEAPENLAEGLKMYQEQFSKLPRTDQQRCPWTEVKARLLANGADLLNKALRLSGKGILFGVDTHGDPLIRDKDTVMLGYNYLDARKQTHLEGYELFTVAHQNALTRYTIVRALTASPLFKGEEIILFEKNMQSPFLKTETEKSRTSNDSWLESGDHGGSMGNAYTIAQPGGQTNIYDHTGIASQSDDLGVVRLLRVKG